MPDGLYERDALAWAEHQASLLRRLAAGERLNDAVDWPNVIEEIQDVGRSDLHACESLLVQAVAHLLKLRAWPESDAGVHWRAETASFLAGARRRFTPSMGRRIDVAGLYADALDQLRARGDGAADRVMQACPFTLEELIGPVDVVALLERLRES